MDKTLTKLAWRSALFAIAVAIVVLPFRATAQDDQRPQDDPPSRVARLGYMEGSVSFQPAGESDWVQAVNNRPMTTGDKVWADKDSRAELQLGSAVIRLSANTGISFLNLDNQTIQVQLSSGAVNLRVRRLSRDDVFEIDTPNLAFTISEPGNYRLEASEDGSNTIVSIRAGGGEATGNGQTYTLRAGQRATFSGTDSLNAEVEPIGGPDPFDSWGDDRDRRYDGSRSAQYLSHDVVGYEDLDDNGDWRDDSQYGHIWFPNRVNPGWAPYREGHWDWIAPWGYTWVDDSSWGYAPFHYGRWVNVDGRWGWLAGPPAEPPVYAPALVVFVGSGAPGFGGNIGWFPLGPREVYVPSYPVSREYVNRVNVSNTTVNTTNITNVYNTTIINKTTNVTNITYVNRTVQGAVTAVPQRTFASAQPVAPAAVKMNAQQIAAAPVSVRPAIAPTQLAVLGSKAATANRVSTPPPAVINRQVIAKATPPPPPVSFAKQQQAMAAHPGDPLPVRELASLRSANTVNAHPTVKQAPPGKPATLTTSRPANPPPNKPDTAKVAQPSTPAKQPEQPDRPPAAGSNNHPETTRPTEPGTTAGGHAASNQPAPPSTPEAVRPATSVPQQPSKAGHAAELPPHQPAPPPSTGNAKTDQKYQQQQGKLAAKQNQDHAKLQQQQEQEHQRLAQQNAIDAQKQQVEAKHQQQTQQLEQKHTQQQQRLQEKQNPPPQ
jgi:hypothetical protein